MSSIELWKSVLLPIVPLPPAASPTAAPVSLSMELNAGGKPSSEPPINAFASNDPVEEIDILPPGKGKSSSIASLS